MEKTLASSQKAYNTVLQFLKDSRNCPTASGQSSIWNKFVENVHDISMDKTFAHSLEIWAMENLMTHHPETVRVRELHEMEASIIPQSVHGRILDALRQGMISITQSEHVIDELMENDPVALEDGETVDEVLTRVWKRNASKYQDMHLN